MSILDADECLYGVLGVAKGSDIATVARAYKKLALKFHPDRNGGDDTAFKKVGYAYSVLKDEGKKKMYDETGMVGGEIDADNLGDLVKMMFQDITEEEISSYMTKRRGSDEEKEEVMEAYRQAKGDFFTLIENVYLESYKEDLRIMKLVDSLIASGELEETPQWAKTKPTPANRKKAAFKKYRSKCEKEAAEVELMRAHTAEATHSKGDVALALKELMKEQYSTLFSNLSEKYGVESDSGSDDGLADITDEQFEAMRKKMEEKKKNTASSPTARTAPKGKRKPVKKRTSSGATPPAKKTKKNMASK